MTPKTELQIQVFKYHTELPPITEKQNAWAYKSLFHHFTVLSRGRFYCLECGSTWKDRAKKETKKCPKCGKKLELQERYHNGYLDQEYTTVITTYKGFQVIRLLLINKHLRKKLPPHFHTYEVEQFWITPKGQLTMVGKTVQGHAMYYDQWALYSDMEIRPIRANHGSTSRSKIRPYKICPGNRILPIVRRNGFNGLFYNFAPQIFLSTILSDSRAETLLKTNQIWLLNEYLNGHTKSIIDRWASIRICIRKNFLVKNGDWFDYLNLLDHFHMNTTAPEKVCPIDFDEAHDRLVLKKERQERKDWLIKNKLKLPGLQAIYEKAKKKFLDIAFTDGLIQVWVLPTIEDFYLEGRALHHCVSSYYTSTDSLIMTARIGNKRVETIQISLQNFVILQSRGLQNKPTEYHDKIIKLVNKNMSLIAKAAGRKVA